MAIWLYSVEGFPGTRESGRSTEYCSMFGIQIILQPSTWTRLDRQYVRYYFKDSVQRGDGTTAQAIPRASREFFTDEELANAIIMKYSGIGMAKLETGDKELPHSASNVAEAKGLEEQALLQNQRYRESVVARFNDERKARQLTGRGRLEPTLYELDCHRALGLPIPGTLAEIKAEHGTTEVKFEMPPDLVDLIRDGISARRAAESQVPKKV